MDGEGRVMALDIGSVRTGVAVSDPLRIIASPHSVIQEATLDATIAAIQALVVELQPVVVVAGVPLDREGQRGPQAEKTMAVVERLRAVLDVEVVTQDERFTTVSAQKMLIAANMKRKKRKQVVDKIAATHILESYLQRQASGRRYD